MLQSEAERIENELDFEPEVDGLDEDESFLDEFDEDELDEEDEGEDFNGYYDEV